LIFPHEVVELLQQLGKTKVTSEWAVAVIFGKNVTEGMDFEKFVDWVYKES